MSFEKGLALYNANKYERAIEWFRSELISSPSAKTKFWLGKALLATHQYHEAFQAFSSCTELEVHEPAQINMAIIEARQDHPFEAENRLRTLLPTQNREIYLNLSSVLYQQGRAKDAQDLLLMYPLENSSTYWYTLGSVQLDLGINEDAHTHFLKAIETNPQNSDAYLWLAGLCVDKKDYMGAVDYLEHILSYDPNHSFVHFHLAALYELLDLPHQSIQHSMKLSFDIHQPWISSWNFIQQNKSTQTIFTGTTQGGFSKLPPRIPGLCLEFGVRFGNSLRRLQSLTDAQWHGFDSFQGLPTEWNEREQGSYSTKGFVPKLGDEITLHSGWFSESLPIFMKNNKGPVSIIHIDCDLYSSTKEALFLLAPWVTSGTILIFDEYIMNPKWDQDEHKAFIEVAQQNNWKYEYHSISVFCWQVVIKIL